MYLREFEFEASNYFGYDDMLDVVQHEAYDIAVQYMDDSGTEPDSNERWELWDNDAMRVREEFRKFYHDDLIKICEEFEASFN